MTIQWFRVVDPNVVLLRAPPRPTQILRRHLPSNLSRRPVRQACAHTLDQSHQLFRSTEPSVRLREKDSRSGECDVGKQIEVLMRRLEAAASAVHRTHTKRSPDGHRARGHHRQIGIVIEAAVRTDRTWDAGFRSPSSSVSPGPVLVHETLQRRLNIGGHFPCSLASRLHDDSRGRVRHKKGHQ